MTTQNLKSVERAIATVNAPNNMTWHVIMSNAKCKKQVQFVQLLNNDGTIYTQSNSLCNISNYEEIENILQMLTCSNNKSFATAKVEQYNERGNNDQYMTYCKHADWVAMVSDCVTRDAILKDTVHVNPNNLENFDIKTWLFNEIQQYTYTLADLLTFETFEGVNDNYIRVGKDLYITQHTKDCFIKAINKYNNYINTINSNNTKKLVNIKASKLDLASKIKASKTCIA